MEQRKTPNILVYHPTAAQAYETRLREAGVTDVLTASTPDEAARLIPDAEVVFSWGLPTPVFRGQTSVRWIQSMGAGVDTFTQNQSDLPSHVMLTRITNQYGGPMAEYVFSYLLYLTKGIQRLSQAQEARTWKPFIPKVLKGKTMGVAGIGSIGGEVVRKARAFDMNVHGLSFSGAQSALVDQHFGPDEWISFVRDLDVLVLVLPLTAETNKLVNRDILLAMKPDAILVNVGRGKLIDELALADVMQAGRLQAAVLDVFESEPLPATHPLWSIPNVYVTPHISGLSSIDATSDFFLENLQRYQSGEPLLGAVDFQRQY
jgi:phosphoglycerate dehydrogenase-like enzyme